VEAGPEPTAQPTRDRRHERVVDRGTAGVGCPFDRVEVAADEGAAASRTDRMIQAAARRPPTGQGFPHGRPGSADYERCLAIGVISPTTELALYEGFNFAVGSDVLSPNAM
jgi:hypothetical protein